MSLRAENLCRAYKGRTIVDSVSFSVEPKEVVGLLGPNGAGKTTSFYMVVGLISADSGEVYLGDEPITHLPMHLRARKGISYLPQNVSIFRKLSVEDNLLSVMEIVGVPRKQRKTRLGALVEKFHLGAIKKSLGVSLSGGERRRVEIARALILEPRFLLLDEPFAGVDPVTVQEIQAIIKSLQEEGLGVLITDHNVRETLESCHRAYVLSSGQMIAHGTPEVISQHQKVREIYLGEKFQL